jgi:polyribonucleotide nucleotidyltransferase
VISSADLDRAHEAQRRITDLTADVEVGQEYDGSVLRLLDCGAIVQVLPGRDGLLHISEIANYRIANINDVLKVGQALRVKVIEADDKGRLRLSVKAIGGIELQGGAPAAPDASAAPAAETPEAPAQ